MKRTLIALCMLFSFTSANAQLLNSGFESWDSSGHYPALWPELASSILTRTTDAHSGNYALEVSVWYYYTETVATQIVPIDYRPTAFCGWYKYTDNIIKNQTTNLITDDTAFAAIYLTKWNSASNTTDTIGQGRIALLGSDVYQHFSCPVTYASTAMPDTVIVSMDPSMMRNGGSYFSTDTTGYNSYLKMDDLYLQRWTTGVAQQAQPEFFLMPNPAGDYIQVTTIGSDIQNYTITNLAGSSVASGIIAGGTANIALTNLAAGPYVIAITNEHNVVMTKMFIKQ